MNGTLAQRALGGAIAGVVATLIGFLFVWTDIWVFGNDPSTHPAPGPTSRWSWETSS